jgi:serine/threonine protein kinase
LYGLRKNHHVTEILTKRNYFMSLNLGPLREGEKINTDTGQSLRIMKYLGEGGQGWVYKVELNGGYYALKWYKKVEYLDIIDAVAFKKNLERNIANGSPAPQFLWPKMLTNNVDETFGYVMDIYPDGYTSFEDYYWGGAYFRSYLSLIDTALCLVEGFKILHNRGYSYQDLNNGGFRVNPNINNPKTVFICDNDNVAPDGTNLGIKGFPGFMAPEVTVGNSRPNTQTDMHSLAVVLFGLFFRHHPLEGKHTLEYSLITPEIESIIYGTHPLFCYHPTDDRNRPHPAVHKNGILHYWPIFPSSFKEYFIKAFTVGLFDSNYRVLGSEWRTALINLRSSIAYVSRSDGKLREQFVNLNDKVVPKGCRKLVFKDGQIAVLSHRSRLYACQTTGNATDFRTVTASIAVHEDTLIMRNDTNDVWRFSLSGQPYERVEPQGILPLVPGVSINFSGVEAVVM